MQIYRYTSEPEFKLNTSLLCYIPRKELYFSLKNMKVITLVTTSIDFFNIELIQTRSTCLNWWLIFHLDIIQRVSRRWTHLSDIFSGNQFSDFFVLSIFGLFASLSRLRSVSLETPESLLMRPSIFFGLRPLCSAFETHLFPEHQSSPSLGRPNRQIHIFLSTKIPEICEQILPSSTDVYSCEAPL